MTLSPNFLPSEWIEPDGFGGFASGTVSGQRSRRYHGLLLHATKPPSGRVMLVKAIAIALGHAGADVVVNYISGEDAAQAVVDEMGRCGSKAYAHQADVSQEGAVAGDV